jgi:serine/threonine protein phosphatase PrpC
MKLRVAGRTNRGTRRDRNEDALVIGHSWSESEDALLSAEYDLEDGGIFAGAADGIGGHQGGEIASAHAAKRLAGTVIHDDASLRALLAEIDRELLDLGERPETYRAGTTLCGILFGARANGVVIGDGILAFHTGRVLRPVGPPWADVVRTTEIRSALGGRDRSVPLTFELLELPLARGLRYVMATDGLVRSLEHSAFKEILQASPDVESVVSRTIDFALERGAPDNITCVVAELIGADE